jgi:hypothetical protein
VRVSLPRGVPALRAPQLPHPIEGRGVFALGPPAATRTALRRRAARDESICMNVEWAWNRDTQNVGYINYTRVMWSDHSYSYDDSAYQVVLLAATCWLSRKQL